MNASKSFYQYTPAAHFLVTDEDAADFLQSQFTNELRPFEAGQCTYGLWLDVKGKVIADSVVICEGAERFRVLSERCEGEAIAAHMERHIIADDVIIELRAPSFGFELSAAGVTALGLDLPTCGRSVRVEGGILFCARKGVYHLVIDSEAAAEAIRAKLLAAGLVASSEAEHGLLRITAGVPLVPDEIGAADLAGEGALEQDAISFTKGCYLGQEVVARMHNLGKPQRGLFVVRGEGALPSVPCSLYNSDSKQVGELRTVYQETSRWCGVALLKTRFAGVGETLRSETNELVVSSVLQGGLEND
ncbi:CAF17-like 4Fe-4S cluster assembly/insertion protein YgfZ [Coraliomargarita sp. W4R53]